MTGVAWSGTALAPIDSVVALARTGHVERLADGPVPWSTAPVVALKQVETVTDAAFQVVVRLDLLGHDEYAGRTVASHTDQAFDLAMVCGGEFDLDDARLRDEFRMLQVAQAEGRCR